MSGRARKLTRRQRRNVEQFRELIASLEGQILQQAGESLHMSVRDIVVGIGTLTGINKTPNLDEAGVANAMMARSIDMLELEGHSRFRGSDLEELRAELAQNCGEEFLIEVAKTGEPASEAALRIRYSGVNLARALALAKNATWVGTNVGWLRRFTRGARRLSSCGRGFVQTSSEGRASQRRSLSGSMAGASTPASSSAPASPSTLSVELAASSSDHRTHSPRLPRSASFTDDTARREAWTLYRLRIQNLLLEVRA